MIVGYSSAWSSPAIADLMMPESYIEVSKYQVSWIGSLMPFAALAGGLMGGSLLEFLGRKTTILCTAVPFIGAGLLVTYAQDVTLIYAGRTITGFCIGIVSLSLPVYLAETIHPEARGTLGLVPTTLGNAGIMLCYILGFWLHWSPQFMACKPCPRPAPCRLPRAMSSQVLSSVCLAFVYIAKAM